MPENDTEAYEKGADAGPKAVAGSPWDYSINEEKEREKALKRTTDRVPNDPSRPIL